MTEKPNFLQQVLDAMDKNPFIENFSVVIVVAVVQLILGSPVTSLLQNVGITNPSPEIVTAVGVTIAILVVGLPLYVFIFLGKKQRLLQLSSKAGLLTIWDNFDAARDEIRNTLLNKEKPVKEVCILIHAGANLIDGSSSIIGGSFEELAKEIGRRKPQSIRILCSALESPYYTDPTYLEERYVSRSNDDDARWSKETYIQTTIGKFQGRTKVIHARIQSLIGYGMSNIEVREHSEPYLWNLIILDNKVFVQGDIYKNSLRNAPVMVFQEEFSSVGDYCSRTYYHTFKKYFEDIWSRKSQKVC